MVNLGSLMLCLHVACQVDEILSASRLACTVRSPLWRHDEGVASVESERAIRWAFLQGYLQHLEGMGVEVLTVVAQRARQPEVVHACDARTHSAIAHDGIVVMLKGVAPPAVCVVCVVCVCPCHASRGRG